MSLSSLLLHSGKVANGQVKVVDEDLDNIFRATAAVPPPSTTLFSSHPTSVEVTAHENKGKKRKARFDVDAATGQAPKRKTTEKKGEREKTSNATLLLNAEEHGEAPKKSKKRDKVAQDIKDRVIATQTPDKDNTSTIPEIVADDSADESDTSQLVHESLKNPTSGGTKSQKPVRRKYVPESESAEKRDARTIFVGNVVSETAKQKPILKQFKRHILSDVPSGKIESVRFRSVAFQKPTSTLPTDADTSPGPSSSKAALSTKLQRQRERAVTWRETEDQEHDTAGQSDAKKFLSEKEKKRVAFIKQDFHSNVDTVNAYVVFAHPLPESSIQRSANVPPPKPVLDPYEAARLAVLKCDGTTFMDRTIRVDLVGKERIEGKQLSGDPKTTVFVGNLDFGAKEEDLRVFFEGIVSVERGPPVADSTGETSTSSENTKAWVSHVRIIRDQDTQLGKGFAYVQFKDRECVDEILALEEGKLKFAKRKLRVQRCKTLPGAPPVKPHPRTAKLNNASPSMTKPKPAVVSIPKGDEALGEKLAHLPKEERKAVKAADAGRIARRLAKKKARSTLEKAGVRVQGKDRDRERVRKGVKHGTKPGSSAKGRVRSAQSLSKRNIKK